MLSRVRQNLKGWNVTMYVSKHELKSSTFDFEIIKFRAFLFSKFKCLWNTEVIPSVLTETMLIGVQCCTIISSLPVVRSVEALSHWTVRVAGGGWEGERQPAHHHHCNTTPPLHSTTMLNQWKTTKGRPPSPAPTERRKGRFHLIIFSSRQKSGLIPL